MEFGQKHIYKSKISAGTSSKQKCVCMIMHSLLLSLSTLVCRSSVSKNPSLSPQRADVLANSYSKKVTRNFDSYMIYFR